MRPIHASLLAAFIATPALAASPFDYSYIEGGWGDQDGGDTVFLEGSWDLQQPFNLVGGIYSIDVGRSDGTALEFGVGAHAPLSNDLDAYGSVRLINVDFDCGPRDCEDTDLMARGGLRFAVDKQLQFEGELAWFNDEVIDDLGIRLGGRWYFDRQLSVAGGFASDTEIDGPYLSLRYDLR